MRMYALVLMLAAAVLVECGHTFLGSNVRRPQVFHKEVQYPSRVFMKRIEYVNYTLPPHHLGSIYGILAYDFTHSGASVNVTQGGIGYSFVNLRLKSDRATELHYDIYVYA